MNVAVLCYQRTSRPVYHEIHVQTICPKFYMLHREITSFNTIPPLMSTSFCMFISIIHFFTMNYRRVGPSLVRPGIFSISTTGRCGSRNASGCGCRYIYILRFGVLNVSDVIGQFNCYTQPRSTILPFNPDVPLAQVRFQ
jgi:hypothetical protein